MEPRRQQALSLLSAALCGATIAAFAAVLLSVNPWTATVYLAVGMLAGTAILVAGMGARSHGLVLITFFVVLGSLTLDFAPLPVYRYLLVSDVLLVAAGVVAWMTGSSLRMPAFVTVCLLLYLINGLATFFWASFSRGFFTWLHSAFLALIYIPFVATALSTRRAFAHYALGGALLCGVVQSVLLLVSVAQGLQWQSGGRISGALGNYSLYIFAVSVIAIAVLLLTGSFAMRVAALLAAVPVIPAMMVTRSRSTWVAAIVGVSLAFVLVPRRKLLGLVAAVFFCGALSAGYVLELYPRPIQNRIARTLTFNPATSRDLVLRVQVVQLMWPRFVRSPFIGVGLNQSYLFLPHEFVESSVASVHNVILHALFEVGLFGAIGYILLPLAVFTLWRRARLLGRNDPSRRRLADFAFISFVAIYAGVQFTPAMYEHAPYFVIALLASLVDHPRSTPEPPSAQVIT